jgi:hypothetical protein
MKIAHFENVKTMSLTAFTALVSEALTSYKFGRSAFANAFSIFSKPNNFLS